MYPPQIDARRETKNPSVFRYRSKGHNTYISNLGAIKIVDIREREIILDKVGIDGKSLELDLPSYIFKSSSLSKVSYSIKILKGE